MITAALFTKTAGQHVYFEELVPICVYARLCRYGGYSNSFVRGDINWTITSSSLLPTAIMATLEKRHYRIQLFNACRAVL